MTNEYRLVRVEWEDITGNTEPWLCIDDALELEPARMTTVGWILADRTDSIIIAGSLGDKKEAGDVNCIPKSVIKTLEYLEEKFYEKFENNIDMPTT